MYPIAANISNIFTERFGTSPLIARSPGRVNIIGEHTDYNEGFVLPAAIDKASFVAVGKRADNKLCLVSADFHEVHEFDLSSISPSKQWHMYVLGVVDQLMKRGYQAGGFNLVLQGDVPIGAGLSSSASVECAVAFALNELFQLNIGALELIDIAQKAEHVYAGVLCGVMDQFISILGKKEQVIKLDCRSMEYEYEPLKLEGVKIVLLNTNVKHSLASTEYNTRRHECNEGLALIRNHIEGINSLRDVTPEMLQQYVAPIDMRVYHRCKYVVEENIRLLEACAALKKGDLPLLGKRMYASHDGLSKEYAVSCTELDFLVDQVRRMPAVLGARMMGGGFGGCTINLVKDDYVAELIAAISDAYHQKMGKELTAYIATTADGASLIKL